MIERKVNEWDYGIQMLQFICCILIVFRHANPIDSFRLGPNSLKSMTEIVPYHIVQLGTFISDVAVPTFFLISGYLYFSNEITVVSYIKKIKSRVQTLVVPYFIWSTLAFLYFAVITHVPFIASHMHMGAVSLSTGSIIKGILLSEYAPLWYMRYLFAFVVFGIAFYQILRKKWVFIISLTILLSINIAAGYQYFSLITWIPFFLMGGGFRNYSFTPIKKRWIQCGLAVSLVIMLIAYVFENDLSGRLLYVYRLISSVCLFFLFESIKYRVSGKWFYNTSMFIYGAHRPVVSSVNKLFSIIIGRSAMSSLVINYITTLFVVLFLLIIARILMISTPKTWQLINGGR